MLAVRWNPLHADLGLRGRDNWSGVRRVHATGKPAAVAAMRIEANGEQASGLTQLSARAWQRGTIKCPASAETCVIATAFSQSRTVPLF